MSSYGLNFPNFQKQKDTAPGSTDLLLPVGFLRKDANDTAMITTDGAYITPTCNDVGNIKVQLEPSRKATFCVQTPLFQAGTGDSWQIFGSASKIIKVHSLCWWGQWNNLAAIWTMYCLKRSTANTGGTSANNTIIPLDSRHTPTAVPKQYTANPTTGTLVGPISTIMVMGIGNYGYNVPNPGVVAPQSGPNKMMVMWDNGDNRGPLTLRGTAEGVVLNGNGVAPPGTLSVQCIWSEE